MFRARLAVLLLSAGLYGCYCCPPPGGAGYLGFSGFGGPAAPCNCGTPPLAAGAGPILEGPPDGGLMPQPGMPPLAAPPRIRPQPLAQPIPAPP